MKSLILLIRIQSIVSPLKTLVKQIDLSHNIPIRIQFTDWWRGFDSNNNFIIRLLFINIKEKYYKTNNKYY